MGGQVTRPTAGIWWSLVNLSCALLDERDRDVVRGDLAESIAAREMILALLAMEVGEDDENYFTDAGYTSAQMDWSITHASALGIEREDRYCDSRGAVRSNT